MDTKNIVEQMNKDVKGLGFDQFSKQEMEACKNYVEKFGMGSLKSYLTQKLGIIITFSSNKLSHMESYRCMEGYSHKHGYHRK